MNYGYARVSSTKQFIAGNGLEEQKAKLRESGCEEIYDEQYTGKTIDRPILNKLLQKLQSGDTFTITKLDRFARSVTEGIEPIREMIARGITVKILNMGTLENTPVGNLLITMLMGFAEFERDLIMERTRAGREIARTKAGYREGRPPIPAIKINNALKLLDDGNTYKEVTAITGISKSTLIRAKNKRKARSVSY